ncbi:glycosyltransferase family A protein [Flavobacterium antarcticum]|uniref:glycosyltransferase family 2 protein n=1 Tax=Flavobacterium antarcticum TaxID=271155 RepID=UPI0003B5229D|nr:glycosyltransferase family A protein [Flavobacterium antarcticum]
MTNKISIIVPCYNQAQFLDEALQSVLDQSYANWECIIINDGSPDCTEIIAQEWLKKDCRFRYIYKENGGLSSARNAGIMVAKGEYILPLDADDKIGTDYLELAIIEFQKDTLLKVVYCNAEKFGYESGSWNLPSFNLKNLGLFNMIFCSALYRKTEWERVKGYDVNMIYSLEDWEFWIAILKNGGTVMRIDTVGFYYRIKEKSMLKNLGVEEKKYLLEYMSIKHADFYVKYYGSFISIHNSYEKISRENFPIVKNRKVICNLFFHTFFGFKLFKNK